MWPLQLVWGDAWAGNVLLAADEPPGWIDPQPVVDHRSRDLARLLGSVPSLSDDDRDAVLSAANITPGEHRLLTVLEQSGILLSWLRWQRAPATDAAFKASRLQQLTPRVLQLLSQQ